MRTAPASFPTVSSLGEPTTKSSVPSKSMSTVFATAKPSCPPRALPETVFKSSWAGAGAERTRTNARREACRMTPSTPGREASLRGDRDLDGVRHREAVRRERAGAPPGDERLGDVLLPDVEGVARDRRRGASEALPVDDDVEAVKL